MFSISVMPSSFGLLPSASTQPHPFLQHPNTTLNHNIHMALLTDLPNELRHRVCSLLDPAGLAVLSRITRHLQLIIEPNLYQRVGLNTMHTTAPVIKHFLYAILSRPSLANYVRTLTLQWTNYQDTTFPTHLRDSTLFASAALRVGIDLFLHNAHVHLLLYYLRHLESIDLAPPDHVSPFNHHRHNGLPTTIPYLRHLTCYWADDCRTMNVDSFIALVTVPRIHTLDMRLAPAIEPTGIPYIPVDLARTSSLTDLTLSFGYLRPESIE